jgi:hypothetical protein
METMPDVSHHEAIHLRRESPVSTIETPKISREDLETKFVELQTNLDNAASSAKDVGKKIGIAAAIILLILAFIIGRKRGAANRTVVEIRRV